MSLPAIANHMAAHGRNGDSMLVHMTPSEVAGLQALAEKHGTSLTINPHTGLPEAFSLKSLVPIAAGAFLGPAGAAIGGGFVSSAMGAAAMVGGVTALASGNLKEGLMAGLGAYGGYGLGAGLAGMGAEQVVEQQADDVLVQKAADRAAQNAGEAAIQAGESGASDAAIDATSKAAMDQSSVANSLKVNATPFNAAQTGQTVQTVTQAPTFSQNFGNASAGFDRLTSPGGIGALNSQMAANSATAMGGPASMLGGIGYAGAGALGMDAMSQKNPAADAKKNDPGYIRQFSYDPYSQRYTALKPVAADKWGSRTFQDAYKAADGGIVALAQGGAVPGYAGGGFTDAQVASYIQDNKLSGEGLQNAANVFQVDADQISRAQALISANDPSLQAAHNAYQDSITANPNAVAENLAFYNPATNSGTGWEDYTIDRFVDTYPNLSYQQIADSAQKYGMDDEDILRAFNRFGYSDADRMAATDESWKNELGITGFAGLSSNINRYVDKMHGMENYTPAEQRALAYDAMYQNGMNMQDVVRATGKTIDELFPDITKSAIKPNIVTPGTVPGGNYGNTSGKTPTPGDITRNPDGTVTVHPNIPGRPDGGFTGMGQVKDAYTQGGGSLGYVSPVVNTAAEHDARYNKQTGGSRAAYDYLMGSGAYPTVPYTPTGQVYKSYGESVLGMPSDPTATPFIWDAQLRRYVPNPQYVKPLTMEEKEAARIAAEKATDAAKETVTKTDVLNAADKEGGNKNGGLMHTYAAGGMSGYGLGGYSDGGRLLRGPGDGVSDSIPASIGNKQPARLADGEFVVPARIVSELGNGSTEAGARKLYAMMDRVQKARGKTTGKGKVATNSRSDKYLPV